MSQTLHLVILCTIFGALAPILPPVTTCVLNEKDFVVSEIQMSWNDAKKKCESSGLSQLVIESQEENLVLNSSAQIKRHLDTSFWSALKFTTTEYIQILWEPSKKSPNVVENNPDGIVKAWAVGEPKDDGNKDREVCVDMEFHGTTPVWSASDCETKKPFICMRPLVVRATAKCGDLPQVKILEGVKVEKDDEDCNSLKLRGEEMKKRGEEIKQKQGGEMLKIRAEEIRRQAEAMKNRNCGGGC